MKENNRGITLLVLSVTIIIILIITSTATYYSISAYNNARLTKFENELKIMQTQVELWEEEGKFDIGESNKTNILSSLKDKSGNLLINEKNHMYYKYLSASKIKEEGIDGIEQDYLVVICLPEISDELTQENLDNILKNRVIAVNGLEYRDKTYHTLEQLQDAGLVVATYSIYGSTNAVASLTNKATGQVTIFSSVQDAIDAAGSNPSIVTLLKDEIKLVDNEDTTINEGIIKIANSQNVILDTNGKTLISSSSYTIYNCGTLTIEGDGVIENTSQYGIYNDSTGTIKITGGVIIGNNDGLQNFDSGNINITGGTIEGKKYTGVVNHNTGTVEITGGVIIGNNDGLQNYGNGNINITGGTIEGKNYAGLVNQDTGTVEITGGTIVGYTEGIDSYSTGVLTLGINNTTITSLPTVIGKTNNGIIITNTTFNFYDGVVKATIQQTINGTIAGKPTGYTPSTTDTIDSEGYYSTTLVSE